MSPILGIYASQDYPRNNNSYESIATVTIGVSPQTSISFSSIPSTYKHLQIRAFVKSGAGNDGTLMRFNGVTSTSNYTDHYVYGDGTSSAAGANVNTSSGLFDFISVPDISFTNIFMTSVTDILDYANTNKNKVVRNLQGFDYNGNGNVQFKSGLFISTSAISSITFVPRGLGTFGQYTSVALYGIKG